MKEYEVRIQAEGTIIVTAESEEEAREKAMDDFEPQNFDEWSVVWSEECDDE